MKISTWNVNSVKARFELLLEWLIEEKPDVVLLQELKCQADQFPYESIEDLGYNIAVNGQKTYNGVAILSKAPLSDINTNIPNNPIPEEARYIEAFVNYGDSGFKVASVYVPNGQDLSSKKYEQKLLFLNSLEQYLKQLLTIDQNLIIAGDFNIAFTDIDVYNISELEESICFSLAERQALRKFSSIGLVDSFRLLNPSEEGFTWWDYRGNSFIRNHGMRIDYIFCSLEVAERLKDCYLSKHLRSKTKPSDHIPITLRLE